MLKDTNEMCASRFAAEILLPEEALNREIKDYLKNMHIKSVKEIQFDDYAAIIMFLTIKYQMPLKAVIYRLAEERYIDNINRFIENYDFMKKVLQGIKIFEKQVNELYSQENNYVIPYSTTYQDMEKAFLTGNASRENILEDAAKLNLDMSLINDFLVEDEDNDLDEDDEILFSIINKKRR